MFAPKARAEKSENGSQPVMLSWCSQLHGRNLVPPARSETKHSGHAKSHPGRVRGLPTPSPYIVSAFKSDIPLLRHLLLESVWAEWVSLWGIAVGALQGQLTGKEQTVAAPTPSKRHKLNSAEPSPALFEFSESDGSDMEDQPTPSMSAAMAAHDASVAGVPPNRTSQQETKEEEVYALEVQLAETVFAHGSPASLGGTFAANQIMAKGGHTLPEAFRRWVPQSASSCSSLDSTHRSRPTPPDRQLKRPNSL